MTECLALQERMPEVAHGQARWSDADTAHLLGCDDCAREWRLVQDSLALGHYRPEYAASMEAELLDRLRNDLPARRVRTIPSRWRAPLWVALAASLALMVWAPLRHRIADAPPVLAETDTSILFPELIPLSETELQRVLDGWEAEDPQLLGGVTPSLDNLNEAQLEVVLRQVEEGP